MEGIRMNGVTLFLGKVPNRKQHCFYFDEGNVCYPVAYISAKNLPEAQRLWAKFIGSIQVGDPRSATETK